jgi:hypothetical protein
MKKTRSKKSHDTVPLMTGKKRRGGRGEPNYTTARKLALCKSLNLLCQDLSDPEAKSKVPGWGIKSTLT